MHVPFDRMPKHSRIWIYQSSRDLTDNEIEFLETNLNNFLDNWQTHGQQLQCSGKFLYRRFLILSVDQAHLSASGCSIDGSVKFVKAMGNELNVDWFSRTDIAFKINNEIMVTPAPKLKQKIINGEINEDTLTFNNLVKDIHEFEENWLVPATDTWVKRYFPN